MGMFNSSVYTNLHELNADFLLETVKYCEGYVRDTAEWRQQMEGRLDSFDAIIESFADYTTFKETVLGELDDLDRDVSGLSSTLDDYAEVKSSALNNAVLLEGFTEWKAAVDANKSATSDYLAFKGSVNSALEQLRTDLNDYIEGGIPDTFLTTLMNYVQENLPSLLSPIESRVGNLESAQSTMAGGLATTNGNVTRLTNRVAAVETALEELDDIGAGVVKQISDAPYHNAVVIPNTLYDVVVDSSEATQAAVWKPALLKICNDYINAPPADKIMLGSYYQKIQISVPQEDPEYTTMVDRGYIIVNHWTMYTVTIEYFSDLNGRHYRCVHNTLTEETKYYNLSDRCGIVCNMSYTNTTSTTAQRTPLTLYSVLNDGDNGNGGINISNNGQYITFDTKGLYQVTLQAYAQSKGSGIHGVRLGYGINSTSVSRYPAQSIYVSASGQAMHINASGVISVKTPGATDFTDAISFMVFQQPSTSTTWQGRIAVTKLSDYVD